jgi:Baseplate J-like protein
MHTSPHVQDTPIAQRADPSSEALVPVADAPDDPEEILLKAVAEIDTQPLPSPPPEMYWPTIFLLVLFFCSYVGGTIVALLTYPTVTITVVPVTKHVTLTAPLALVTRILAPVMLTKSLTTDTTGKGHQVARSASGTLTFYNGQAGPQTIPIGTILTGQDGVKVATDQTVTIPAGTPPTYGQVSVTAHALVPGRVGNIPAGDINATIALAVFVKNAAFAGGQDQRDYQVVAQGDQESVALQLRSILTQELPQAFSLAPGEQVFPANCAFKVSPNHQVGAEASTLTVMATETCHGIAYDLDQLRQQATTLFARQTAPGSHYQLVGEIQVQVVSVTPFTVSCRGLWVYNLPEDYEQFLAEQVAGHTPAQARKYLLQVGVFTRVMVSEQLPPDPAHIRFQVMIGI